MNKNIHYTATRINCELENDIYNYIESQLAKKLVQKAAAGHKQYFYYGSDADNTVMQVAMTDEEAKHLAESSVLLAERLMVLYGKMTLQNPLFAHTAVTIFNGLLGATTMRYKVLKDTPAGVMEGMHIESAAV